MTKTVESLPLTHPSQGSQILHPSTQVPRKYLEKFEKQKD